MFELKCLTIVEGIDALFSLPSKKLLINTINAHSYNMALKDEQFAEALMMGDALIPDGASIVKACRWIHAKSQPKERIAGWDLFAFEMEQLNTQAATGNKEKKELPKVMFLGSSEHVLSLIKRRAKDIYPHLNVVTYSPPYKKVFSTEDNEAMVAAVNREHPDLLWIGMTAPKQEKWTYAHWDELDIDCHVGTIGAVFDFFAGTAKRAPKWWQEHSLEWLYRLVKEPQRMWKRYLVGNALFVWNILFHEVLGK